MNTNRADAPNDMTPDSIYASIPRSSIKRMGSCSVKKVFRADALYVRDDSPELVRLRRIAKIVDETGLAGMAMNDELWRLIREYRALLSAQPKVGE